MTDNARRPPLSVGTISVIVILAGVVVGALLGVLRSQMGGSALLTGGLAGFLVGVLASVLYSRRARALRSQQGC